MNITVESDIKEIKREIKELRDSINHLTIIINEINKSCKNMDSHISFIEFIYAKVSIPLNYIKSSYESYFMHESNNALPLTKDDMLK